MVAPAIDLNSIENMKKQLWFENYVPRTVYEFGSIFMDKEKIIAFASEFDPQPFHIDMELAEKSEFGGLIASGWHTAAATMRLLVDHFLSESSSLGSPGIDELRWLKPVRPSETLRVRVTILDTRKSKSKPDRGFVRSKIETLNSEEETVMSLIATTIVLCEIEV
jgi:acyl dehydratase